MRKLLNLFIEHTIALVDVGDVTLVLVVSLSRELALLVDTVRELRDDKSVYKYQQYDKNVLFVHLRDYPIDSIFRWLVVSIQQRVGIPVQ